MYCAIDQYKEQKVRTVKRHRGQEEMLISTPTTLYDLIATLQDIIAPNEDECVVAAVMYMLNSGWIVLQHDRYR